MVSLFDKLQCFLAILTTIALEAKLLEQASHSKKIHTAVIDHENPWTLAFYNRAQIVLVSMLWKQKSTDANVSLAVILF